MDPAQLVRWATGDRPELLPCGQAFSDERRGWGVGRIRRDVRYFYEAAVDAG